MVEILRGRIAAFLSQSKVAINIGLEDGVKEGMNFIIYEEGELIFDPETHDPLEKIELIKGKIEITSVQEKISIGGSFAIIAGELLESYMDLLSPLARVGRMMSSKRVEKSLTDAVISQSHPGPIIVGDLVRQVISNLEDVPNSDNAS